jgi:Fe-S-cluster containining protein
MDAHDAALSSERVRRIPEVNPIPTPSIDMRLQKLRHDLLDLNDFPDDEFMAIIREVGFGCDCCGRCCTREFNGYVFLLEEDTDRLRAIRPDALVPAPDYDACDQHGRFYVSGYALRTRSDGSCTFLEKGRCTIYDRRFSICRVYPYMLHKEADEEGTVDWRQISGLNEHGCYHTVIDDEECARIARETRKYETAFIEQEIRFWEAVRDCFAAGGLRQVRRIYDLRMRDFQRGETIEVLVFHHGRFEPHRVSRIDYEW